MPVPICRRHVCSMLYVTSIASVSERPVAENAMWSMTPGFSFSRGLPPTTCRIAASPA